MMVSSIFKSFAMGTVLFASHASGQNNWDINFLTATADFENGNTNDIKMDYEIGTARSSYTVELFDTSCTQAISAPIFEIGTSITAKDDNHDTIEILVNVDLAQLPSQNTFYDPLSGRLSFCTKVQLFTSNSIAIVEDSRKVFIKFDFEDSFDNTKDSIQLEQKALEGQEFTGKLSSYVQACICDGADSVVCNTNKVGLNTNLNICIYTEFPGVKVDYVTSLSVTQGDNEFVIVQNDVLLDETISSKTKNQAENRLHVVSKLPAGFFSFDEDTSAQVSGLVRVVLERRLAVEITVQSIVETTGSTRALVKRFGDQAPFVIDLQLEREFDANSANMQSALFAVRYIAPIVVTIVTAMML